MQSNAPPVLIVDHGDSLKVRAESTKQKAAKTKKSPLALANRPSRGFCLSGIDNDKN